jgi:hypothetical protein
MARPFAHTEEEIHPSFNAAILKTSTDADQLIFALVNDQLQSFSPTDLQIHVD